MNPNASRPLSSVPYSDYRLDPGLMPSASRATLAGNPLEVYKHPFFQK
jgi:hypothetical protein